MNHKRIIAGDVMNMVPIWITILFDTCIGVILSIKMYHYIVNTVIPEPITWNIITLVVFVCGIISIAATIVWSLKHAIRIAKENKQLNERMNILED